MRGIDVREFLAPGRKANGPTARMKMSGRAMRSEFVPGYEVAACELSPPDRSPGEDRQTKASSDRTACPP